VREGPGAALLQDSELIAFYIGGQVHVDTESHNDNKEEPRDATVNPL
jgi:hypothetical protein